MGQGSEDIEINTPAAQFIKGKDGVQYDMNNLSGARRQELLDNKVITLDTLTSPANMPGKKLKALREAYREKYEAQNGKEKEETKKAKEVDSLPYKVGDTVIVKKMAVEVLDVRGDRGVKYKNKDGELKWCAFERVQPVTSSNEEETEE